MNTGRSYLSYFRTIGSFIAAKMLSLFKLSVIVGSHCAFLSGTSMVMPLVGLFGGVLGATALCSMSIVVRYFLFGISSLSILAFYIPGWCASVYLASHHWSVRLLLPLACMVAFIAHPVGGAAWLYAMYWIIPMAVYVSQRTHIFYQALGATFTAHAVGSVIWLYTVGMTAELWLGLIPVVACERLAYAAGMVVAYHVIMALSTHMVRFGNYVYRRDMHRANV